MVIFKHLEENSGFQETDGDAYECKTCKKRFKSFQALGGHQGIHKIRIKPNEDDAMCMLSLNIIPTGLHRCKMCSKVFETGQKLGGHMRKHRDEKAMNLIKKQELWRQKSDSVLTMEELERRKVEVDERMRARRELILAAKEWRLWF